MLSPSQYLNATNFSGQFSLPPFTPYSLLTLNNSNLPSGGTPPFVPSDNGNDKTQIGVNDTPTQNAGITANDLLCTISPAACLGSMGANALGFGAEFNYYLKSTGLLLLALILLAFGLYMLANSTNTGKAIINVATKV